MSGMTQSDGMCVCTVCAHVHPCVWAWVCKQGPLGALPQTLGACAPEEWVCVVSGLGKSDRSVLQVLKEKWLWTEQKMELPGLWAVLLRTGPLGQVSETDQRLHTAGIGVSERICLNADVTVRLHPDTPDQTLGDTAQESIPKKRKVGQAVLLCEQVW